MWKRHELLQNKIGVLPDEELSFENLNSIFYVVVGLIPTLTLLEIIMYCLYQCKVSETKSLNFEPLTIYFKFHPWKEILYNEEVGCNENKDNVKITTILYCLFLLCIALCIIVACMIDTSMKHMCCIFSSVS